MSRCEDFPCCGHEMGDCPREAPDGTLVYRCVECGDDLPPAARSSICRDCLYEARRRAAERGSDFLWED